MEKIRNKIIDNINNNKNDGVYINICRAINGSKLDNKSISLLFNEFMPKNEFFRSEIDELIGYLINVSKR